MASPFVDEEEIKQILEQLDAEGTRKADFEPQTLTSDPVGPGRDESVPPPVIGDRELAAGLRDSSVGSVPDYEDDHVDATAKAPEPDRPQFGDIPKFDEKGRIIENFKTDEISGLLKELEAAQGKDRVKKKSARRSAHTLNAGEAISSAFTNRPGRFIDAPEAYDESKAVMDKAGLSDKLQTNEMKRRNPAEERELKDILKRLELEEAAKRQIAKFDQEQKIVDDKQTHDTGEKKKQRDWSGDQKNKDRAAGLTRPVIAATVSAGKEGKGQDSKFANTQAERQIPMYDQIKPNSSTDQSTGAELSGSMAAMEETSRKAIEVMRKYGPNFPKSTEWLKLESDFMAMNQVLNRLNQNGVMNFKDQENNVKQIGDPQTLIQYIMQNGPDVLEHSVATSRAMTNQRMQQLGYKYNKDWKAKAASEYLPKASGGGSSQSGPLQDPNVLDQTIKAINEGGKMPKFNTPPGQPQAPQTKKARWDPNLGKMVDENGNPI